MGKPKKSNGVGHNSGDEVADTDLADLQAYFSLKIRAQRRICAESKAQADADREDLNALFSQARGEVGLKRKEFEEILALQDMNETEFRLHELKRHGWMRNAGLPVGTQLELFPENGDTVDDKIDAEANGYRAGRRGDDPVPPDFIHAMFKSDWMDGWHRGQSANGEALGRAHVILDARKTAKSAGKMQPADDAGEGGEEGDGDKGDFGPTVAEAELETV